MRFVSRHIGEESIILMGGIRINNSIFRDAKAYAAKASLLPARERLNFNTVDARSRLLDSRPVC